MPFRTAATEMLGIQHPIVCGGMTATGSAELAAAISNAGGLGMLTALHAKTPERLDALIKQCRAMTEKPFGVNLTILGEKRGAPEFPHEFCQVVTANGIKIMETCGSNPTLMTELNRTLREGGVEVIMTKCVQIRHALTAERRLGSDMVTLMGFDSGGLPGEADIGMWTQMALAKQKLAIPFLVSGGVATGAQLLAALASGASGVQIGTRFNATQECNIFPMQFKQKMLEASERDTVVVMKPFKASSRVLKNKTADRMLAIEADMAKSGAASFAQYNSLGKFETLMDGISKSDPDTGVWNCGQVVGLIDDLPTCRELIDRIVTEAETTYASMSSLVVSAKL